MMEAQLQDFRAILQARLDRIQFRDRLAEHPELCVSAGGLHMPIEIHGFLISMSLANATCIVDVRNRSRDAQLSGKLPAPLYSYSSKASSSANLRSKRRSVLSTGADVVMSTPAACRVSRGNFDPPERRKFR